MGQQQRKIILQLKDGSTSKAIATGNNASWLCYCSRKLPLLGKSGQYKGASEKTKVVCADCGAEYFVSPDGADYKRAVKVIEL